MQDLEKLFNRKNYTEFQKAVESREDYEFLLAKPNTYQAQPSTGIFIKIEGRKCYNGIWKDNYLYCIDTCCGSSGRGRPFDPIDVGILDYHEIICILYDDLGLTPPQKKQLSFFDLDMC